MLYGRVTIGHLNSKTSEGGYAVHAILEKSEVDHKLRLAYYEVFMVSDASSSLSFILQDLSSSFYHIC